MQNISSCWRVGSSTAFQRRVLMTGRISSLAAAPATTPPWASFNGANPPTATSPSGAATTATTTVATTLTDSAAPHQLDLLSMRGVLFDVDGTLVESDPLHFRSFQEILVEVGFNGGQPIDEAFFRRHISGRHNPEIAADLFPGWAEDRRVAFYTEKEERYRRLAAGGLEPLEGLREFVQWVRQRGLRTAAVTNAPRANAEMMLTALGLESVFEHLVLGEECTRAKPHPDPYLTAMQLLGLTPAEVVVFEDSPSGVAAGVAAGAPVVALTTGQEPDVLRRAGAVWIVRDFRDIMAAVRAAEAGAETATAPTRGGWAEELESSS